MSVLRHGFTLIEVLVVVAIIGLLTGVGIASYNNFNEKQQVQQAAMNFASELRKVQKRTNAGERPDGCTGALQQYDVTTIANNTNATITMTCSLTSPSPEPFELGKQVVFDSAASFIFKTLNQGLDSAAEVVIEGVNSGQKYKVTAEAGGAITVTEEP